MSNKRNLKKHIEYVCGELAAQCLVSSSLIEGVDREKMNSVVVRIALLQDNSLKHVGISFDQSPSSFADGRAYHKARNAYFRSAYRSLLDSFRKEVTAIVDEMNAAMPRKEK